MHMRTDKMNNNSDKLRLKRQKGKQTGRHTEKMMNG